MVINFDFRFIDVPQKTINKELLAEFIHDSSTKRIHFATVHKNALKPGEDGVVGWLNLPFDQPFESIARSELGMSRVTFPPRSGSSFYRLIGNQEEFDKIQDFINKYNDIVFLRDCLDLSVALSMYDYYPEGEESPVRTVLGQHEYEVKYESDKKDTSADMEALVSEMQSRLEQLPYFKLADCICAVPSSKPFMKEIISRLKGFAFVDISSGVIWSNKTDEMKDAENAERKLALIESSNLSINVNVKGKTVLLIDDMYNSGVTMQYVAMKLKEAGAKRVLGMTLCKSLSNK